MITLKLILIIISIALSFVGGPMGLPLNPNAPQNKAIQTQQASLQQRPVKNDSQDILLP